MKSKTLVLGSRESSSSQVDSLLGFLAQRSSAQLVTPKVIQGLKSRILFKGSIKANKLPKINWHPICCQARNLVSTLRGWDERL